MCNHPPRSVSGGLGVVPVTGHDGAAPYDHLADLALRQGVVAVVHDAHVDRRQGRAGGGEPLQIAWVAGIAVGRLRQPGNGHRRLPLAIHLDQLGPDTVDRAQEVLHVHGTATVGEGFQAGRGRGLQPRLLEQAQYHRRRQEQRRSGMLPHQADHLGSVEAAALRNHVVGASRQMRQRVQPGAVRHRRRVNDAVAGVDDIHVGEVAQRHRQQIAMRQHGALGLSGRAAGVEDPRRSAGCDVAIGDRVRGGEQGSIVGRPRTDDPFQGRYRIGQRRHRCLQVGAGEAPAGAAVVQNVSQLPRMKLGVDGHGGVTGAPDGAQHLKVLRRVGHDQGHPLPAGGAELGADAARQAAHPTTQLGVSRAHLPADGHRRPVGVSHSRSGEQGGDVHRGVRDRELSRSDGTVTPWRGRQ